MLTFDNLTRHWPKAPHSLTEAIAASAPLVLPKYIDSPLRLAHFMAHCSVECAAGTELEENLNYTAGRIHAVFPNYFQSTALAQAYAHNPRGLADRVYNGRMGNRVGSDDGWNYRGRGLINLTGGDNYRTIGTATGIDLATLPEMASAYGRCLEVAAAFWQHINANRFADADDIVHGTEIINGGMNGLAERKVWLGIWKREFAVV